METGKHIIDDITITTNADTTFQQEFANPLLDQALDMRERSFPDYNYQKHFANTQKSATNLSDGNFVFVINSNHPWLLRSLYFDVTVKLTVGKRLDKKYLVLPDFYNGLMSSIKIQVGQNSQEIDKIDGLNQQWSYIWKSLETTIDDYALQMGPIDLMIQDTPGSLQLGADGTVPAANKGGTSRLNKMYEKTVTEGTDTVIIMRGKFRPAHLFFQKDKMFPPFVPLTIRMCSNDPRAIMLQADKTEGVKPIFTDLHVHYDSFEILQGGYEKFERAFANANLSYNIDEPINPYKSRLATYYYLDVRAQKFTVPSAVNYWNQTIRMGSNLPKAVVFCMTKYKEDNAKENHLQFDLNHIKCYKLVVNSQSKNACGICKSDTSSPYQDFFIQLREFLGAGFTNKNIGLTYDEFENGTGIMAELINPQNTLNVHSKLEVGTLELSLEFTETLKSSYSLYTFLIFDQTLVIDEKGNGNLVIST